MALFANLVFEDRLQVKDKTRLDGSQSFVSKGSNPITSMTITPGADGSALNVFNDDEEKRFLDWQFNDFKIDIDSSNNKINFKEGGSELTATLSSATYTLATLATEIKTQLDAAGANTYTVSVSNDDKVTISADGSFSLLINEGTNKLTSILPILGFVVKPGFSDTEFSGITTVTGVRVRSMPRAVTIAIGDGDSTDTVTEYISVYSEAGDHLFSTDANLRRHRHDILEFLPDGRNSFKHMHRRAQDIIMAFFDENGHTDVYGDPLTVSAIVDVNEVRQWSIFLTLRLIHDELSNSVDDDFYQKARMYEASEVQHRNRVILRLDRDKDGKADLGEGIGVLGGGVYRR